MLLPVVQQATLLTATHSNEFMLLMQKHTAATSKHAPSLYCAAGKVYRQHCINTSARAAAAAAVEAAVSTIAAHTSAVPAPRGQ
jgi:hypothetical protein